MRESKLSKAELLQKIDDLENKIIQLNTSKNHLISDENWAFSILKSIPDVIFIYSLNLVYESIIPGIDDNDFIIPIEDHIGKNIDQVNLPKKIKELFTKHVNLLKETGIPQKYEYAINIKGKEKWFSTVINYRTNENHKPIGITSVVGDVTERKLTDLKFKTIANYTKNWAFWRDVEGETIYISPACETISGYSQQEFIDNPTLYKGIIHPDDKELYNNHSAKIMVDKSDGEIDFRVITKSGDIRWINHRCNELYEEGHPIGRRVSNMDITDRKSVEKEMEYLATHDPLTDLPNRVLFAELSRQAIIRTERNQWISAILFFDLDNFKGINDSYGHQGGDKFLQWITAQVKKSIRSSDTLARFSGDEFVLFLDNVGSVENLEYICKNILAQISKPDAINPLNIKVSASIGICMVPEHGNDIESLLKKADNAMYAAKTSGKNNYKFYNKNMSTT
jgi:diguanylate cyclase (GGDEF)-like protein/PAS domain S-box-containing protein